VTHQEQKNNRKEKKICQIAHNNARGVENDGSVLLISPCCAVKFESAMNKEENKNVTACVKTPPPQCPSPIT
jgi:hypothetical protein